MRLEVTGGFEWTCCSSLIGLTNVWYMPEATLCLQKQLGSKDCLFIILITASRSTMQNDAAVAIHQRAALIRTQGGREMARTSGPSTPDISNGFRDVTEEERQQAAMPLTHEELSMLWGVVKGTLILDRAAPGTPYRQILAEKLRKLLKKT